MFGAYGHTGRFVVAELCKRGWTPILCGRDAGKLETLGIPYPGLQARVAAIEDPRSLDRAFSGAAAVINCAGPFLDTAAAVLDAALRARMHYFDVAAEQAAVLDVFQRFSTRAREEGVVVIPAMAFYGGLGDLLATAAKADWTDMDEIQIAVALDSWLPTRGTRLTGQRNTARRLVVSNNKLEPLDESTPTRTWNFPTPFASQSVVALPFSEIITMSRHLRSPEIHAYMNLEPLKDVRDPKTPPPTAVDESGRSAQTFVFEVVVRRRNQQRRAVALGRDIYAITAPIVVEAVIRVVGGLKEKAGAFAPGEIFDARDFLGSLCPDHMQVAIS
ncbi:MAG TPA: saccharopine dehydrogenase NADP-binding domain-containing protein [Rudaea sp.]|nr:saccharopine dehydrogenase NADP-binding domain-containing protein [Rudaea sp.]